MKLIDHLFNRFKFVADRLDLSECYGLHDEYSEENLYWCKRTFEEMVNYCSLDKGDYIANVSYHGDVVTIGQYAEKFRINCCKNYEGKPIIISATVVVILQNGKFAVISTGCDSRFTIKQFPPAMIDSNFLIEWSRQFKNHDVIETQILK